MNVLVDMEDQNAEIVLLMRGLLAHLQECPAASPAMLAEVVDELKCTDSSVYSDTEEVWSTVRGWIHEHYAVPSCPDQGYRRYSDFDANFRVVNDRLAP